MSELRKLAEELTALADRYDKLADSSEVALAEIVLDAEAFHAAVEWMNGSDPPCCFDACPNGLSACDRAQDETGKCFRDLWRKQAREQNEE